MESTNHKIIKNFITKQQADEICQFVVSLNHTGDDCNFHLKDLSKSLKGKSNIFDISNTPLTNYTTKFQSISDVSNDTLPKYIIDLIDNIANILHLPTDHVFLQAVNMNNGGKIKAHYDPSISGYINYKCNISVLTDKYDFYIDNQKFEIEECDLYCFEASLYKHWTDKFNSKRVFLSIGFIVPYEILNRNENDPRIRLSKRIEKYFQNI